MKCPTCGCSNYLPKFTSLNAFQQEVKKLWEDNKEKGLVIEAPRCIGKTTILMDLAFEESKTKQVFYVCRTYHNKCNIEKEFKNRFGINTIKVVVTEDSISLTDLLKDHYIFYDEVEGKQEPNSLRIYTPEEKKYIFGKEWVENIGAWEFYTDDNRKKLMGDAWFNRDFETNIWSKQ